MKSVNREVANPTISAALIFLRYGYKLRVKPYLLGAQRYKHHLFDGE